ncbi:YegP family protein [Flavobacterium rhizosphaerae]|uniref:YegP family protein n=1 Tax=Flavobacterium rhizosphaerae TaxID=3163298 RepID=A0ABW8YXV7_9FLAO
MIVISKRTNRDYKFVFASKKGKTIFTSIGCKEKADCERMIAGIKENIAKLTFSRKTTPSGKYFFRISTGGLVLATSRKYSTTYSLEKGIEMILKYLPDTETLDFSDNDFVFADEEANGPAVQDV